MGYTALSLLLIFFIILGPIIKFTNKLLMEWYDRNYFKYGFLSRYYLSTKLTSSEFENWCRYILKNLGYKDFQNISETVNGSVNLTCNLDGDKTYISTKLLGKCKEEKNNDNDKYETIGRPELQMFIGALVHDNINHGVLITTGDFTAEAREYAEALPSKYTLTLIDGITLTKLLRKIRKTEIADRFNHALVTQRGE